VTNSVFFNSPAAQWEEALPLGNGRLGAMIFGSPDRERIQLNEDSIWSGNFRDRNNPAAKEALAEIRKLLNEGRAAEAEDLCLECFSGIPPAQRVYQTAGELQISFSPKGMFGHPWSGTRGGALLTGVSNYRRELDLGRAVHTLSFEHEGIIYKRECFISAPVASATLAASAVPSGLLSLRFTAESADGSKASGKISFRASLDRGVFYDRKGNTQGAAYLCRDTNIPFCVMFKVLQKGGTQKSRGGFITVEDADEALLLLDIQTKFREDGFEAACLENINRALQFGAAENCWEKLLQEHIDDYSSLYSRMQFNLNESAANDELVRYFNFCRYLLISCSRPGTLPANLQGLWNPHMDPPWGCDYTININAQMNYWAACMCNLAETEEPLFDLLERMYPNGKHTAQVMYGCRGFTAHHNTDLWGDTAPRDYWIPASYWTLGAAWLSLHIWEHYEYTMDIFFLKKYFYLLKDACVFFVDFLTPGTKTNEEGEPYLIVSPSVSPENSYLQTSSAWKATAKSDPVSVSLCNGCAMDDQILRKLFSAAILSAKILGIDDSDTRQFHSVLKRLALPSIHSNGTIREWNDEYEEAEPGHRHFSHLWALWPGDAIIIEEKQQNNDSSPSNAALLSAAKKSIERRLAADGGHTGWSRAWLVNFYARLAEGETALENLNELFKDFTLPNLFNNGPPFQIDGNFGALSGITQMLMQSRICRGEQGEASSADWLIKTEIKILPALPKSWTSGSVKGLRAKGNLEIDFEWREGEVTSLDIRNIGTEEVHVVVYHNGKKQNMTLKPSASN